MQVKSTTHDRMFVCALYSLYVGGFMIFKLIRNTCFACNYQQLGYARNGTSGSKNKILRPLNNKSFFHITFVKLSPKCTKTRRKCFPGVVLFDNCFHSATLPGFSFIWFWGFLAFSSVYTINQMLN